MLLLRAAWCCRHEARGAELVVFSYSLEAEGGGAHSPPRALDRCPRGLGRRARDRAAGAAGVGRGWGALRHSPHPGAPHPTVGHAAAHNLLRRSCPGDGVRRFAPSRTRVVALPGEFLRGHPSATALRGTAIGAAMCCSTRAPSRLLLLAPFSEALAADAPPGGRACAAVRNLRHHPPGLQRPPLLDRKRQRHPSACRCRPPYLVGSSFVGMVRRRRWSWPRLHSAAAA